MYTRRILSWLIFAGLLLACNFPMFASATPSVQATATNALLGTPTSALPTFTVVPSAAPTATTVPTPTVPEATPNSVAVNCRLGPDIGWAATSYVGVGETTQIAGRNDDSSWWYVHDLHNAGSFCWIAASVVTTAGNLSGLPVIPPPTATVTKVTVDASVGSPVYCGGPNSVQFSGKITTNGPTKVKFQWEIRGDKSNTTPPETINFNSADTKDAPDPGAYTADCGNYSITLHILDPNDTSAKKNFKIEP